MDFVKKAAAQMGSSSNQNQQQQQQTGETQQTQQTGNTGTNTTGTQQSQDYGDKAFDAISKKAGHDFTPAQDEKITDAARGAYEKYSGAPVNQKYSN